MRSLNSRSLLLCCVWVTLSTTTATCGREGGRHHDKPCEANVESPPALPTTPSSPSKKPSAFPLTKPSPAPTSNPTGVPKRATTLTPTIDHSFDPSSYPSVAPSAKPTSSPSRRITPTALPTATTSRTPSSPTTNRAPTSAPAPTLSPAPTVTSVPTVSSALTTTEAPSFTPVSSKTRSPTTSPAPTEKSLPTVSAAPTRTAVPTIPVSPTVTAKPSHTTGCNSNDNGFFGVASKNEIRVQFAYELETSQGDVETEILPSLERAFNDKILPFLFDTKCGGSNSRVRLAARRLAALGVSTRPDDAVVQDVSCSEKLKSSNDCVVVKGELTIFVDGSSNDEEDVALSAIQEGMEKGDFVTAHEGIVRVTYVDIEAVNPIQNDPGTDKQATIDNRHGLLYGFVAGLVMLLLVALALLVQGGNTRLDLSSFMLKSS